jgi:hypothetical protein
LKQSALLSYTTAAVGITDEITMSCMLKSICLFLVRWIQNKPIRVRNSSRTTAGPMRGNMTAKMAAKMTAKVPHPIVIIGLYGLG